MEVLGGARISAVSVRAMEELKFPSDVKFRAFYMVPEAFSHPAKMNCFLQIELFKRYTKENDIVLDPMAGIGTALLGALMGRNVICVELEEKFVKIMERNWEKMLSVACSCFLLPFINEEPRVGRAAIIQGDARNLCRILREKVDVSIFSPPYADAKKGKVDLDKMVERWNAQYREEWNSWGRNWGTEGRRRGLESLGSGYSENPDNIGNLPFGEVDRIITSPPYSEALRSKHDWEEENRKYLEKTTDKRRKGAQWIYARQGDRYSDSPDNLGNLPHGDIDAAIFSPPFGNTFSDWDMKSRAAKEGFEPYSDERFREKRNIGNIPYYSEDLESKRSPKPPKGKPTYLGEMLKVYKQCYEVLKPGGLLVVVVKDFVRNKKLVPLHEHTKLLCEKAGFKFVEEWWHKFERMSFWRILQKKRFPESEIPDKEYVLVFEKNG